ncbi:MAG: transposase [Candidatus Thiodiazotropha sp. (ex Gloverina cf. vestifex)]|nr:transposase [Candidatus Thiodiazotropha sp. (ex Gloverina cf. vestifex)]
MTGRFDFNEALKVIRSGQAITGKDGVLAPLLKQLTEAALEAELESRIANDVAPNRKNGKSQKTFKTSEGRIGLNTPRDRAGTLGHIWGDKYPIVIQSWRKKWDNLSVYFRYPEDIRRVIYTTNSIEAVYRQFRKPTKTKGVFPNGLARRLLKLLYLGIQNASKKWTMPIHNWNLTISQLTIFFEGRLDGALDL